MNIYFCGSIRGGRELALTYGYIIEVLQKHGTVLTEHVGNDEVIQGESRELSDREIHDRDLRWILDSEVLVAEVTVPSLGVGYEIGRAIEMGKPVLCLFAARSDRALSAMIAGSNKVILKTYTKKEEIKDILEEFFKGHAPHRTS